jgi:hypothetical protein
MKRIPRFRADEEAVAGPVTMILIIALITTIIGAVMVISVPVWVGNAEAQHMKTISNNFIDLKKNIDNQIKTGDLDITSGTAFSMKSDPPTSFLGITGETLYGEMTVDPYNEITNISNTDDPTEIYGTAQGAVIFESRNTQYPDQVYLYHNGAVQRIQEESMSKGLFIATSGFSVTDYGGNRTVRYSSITIFGEMSSITGSSSVVLQTRAISAIEATYKGGLWETDGINLTIGISSHLGYATVYYKYFNDTLADNPDLTAGTDYTVTRVGDNVDVEIKDVNSLVLIQGIIEVKFV